MTISDCSEPEPVSVMAATAGFTGNFDSDTQYDPREERQ